MATLEELQNKYHQCPNAVRFGELPVVAPTYDSFRKYSVPVEEVIQLMKTCGNRLLELNDGELAEDECEGIRDIIAEMDLPQFKLYVEEKIKGE